MAIRFDSREECIFYLARLIADSGSLEEIGAWYASDPRWAEKVAGVHEGNKRRAEVI